MFFYVETIKLEQLVYICIVLSEYKTSTSLFDEQ